MRDSVFRARRWGTLLATGVAPAMLLPLAAGVAALLLTALDAPAEPHRYPAPRSPLETRADDSASDSPLPQASTLSSAGAVLETGWRDHVALRLRGLEYRNEFVFRNQSFQLRLSGPVVRGAPGLRLELRGWSIRGAATSVSAFGSTKRQGIRLKIEF